MRYGTWQYPRGDAPPPLLEVELDKWYSDLPSYFPRRVRTQPAMPARGYHVAEEVTVDKWHSDLPSYFPRQERAQPPPDLVFSDEVVELDWHSDLPGYFPRPHRSQPGSLGSDLEVPAAELVTVDKWYSDLPQYFPAPPRPQPDPAMVFSDEFVEPSKWYSDLPSRLVRAYRKQPEAMVWYEMPTAIGLTFNIEIPPVEFAIGHELPSPPEFAIGHELPELGVDL